MALQGPGGEDVYATLLLTDTYLPGALVLAHSLRDAGTTKKLAALVTLDTVSAEAIAQLKSVYHYVIPVPRIRNAQSANLQLMNRTDLHSAFTKIHLWRQTQFRKIVYIDADIVAYRAPDELFDISHPFSAAPDIGWPDLFNTGVMVLTPNMGDYYAMTAMAERGISFDGADQGLINTHFRNNYNRISFAYNVTPSAHYQYIPAYRHFQSSINMVHFIGSDKPWFMGRHASTGGSTFDEMTGRWWAVYDRHYRAAAPQPPGSTSTQSASSTFVQPSDSTFAQPPDTVTASQPVSQLVQFYTKGEYQPMSSHMEAFSGHHSHAHHDHEHHDYHATTQPHGQHHQNDDQFIHHHDPPNTVIHHGHHGHPEHPEHPEHHDHPQHQDAHNHQAHPPTETIIQQPGPSSFVSSDAISSSGNYGDTRAEAGQEQIQAQGLPVPFPEPEQNPPPFEPTMSSWDAQRHPPPAESKPEALNFPATVYEMSKSPTPFIPPRQYPSPPKNMWYDVPREAPATLSEPPKPIFPWEAHRSKPTRVFVDDELLVAQGFGTREIDAPSGEQQSEPSVTDASTVEQRSQPATPTTPTIQVTPSDPWGSYTRGNAWDEVPEIDRYVDSMRKHQRSRSFRSLGVIGLPSPGEDVAATGRRRGSKITDFPSAVERPSLPVTPAPVHGTTFWGGGAKIGEDSDNPLLPSAVGVPGQDDWVCLHGRWWTRADCRCEIR